MRRFFVNAESRSACILAELIGNGQRGRGPDDGAEDALNLGGLGPDAGTAFYKNPLFHECQAF
ncbi:hypothetical protein BN2475_930009 [Paraburkholderia ribeironis]|uniref:Uncharacterized protein n=1 Tax=Paraburkholderia ribeironis TaxID=1247936 RepID=A0A1N7SL80_9BURK|nr:hypothetical protein BN2475_930009 [Paraburkholderia ribeironis]